VTPEDTLVSPDADPAPRSEGLGRGRRGLPPRALRPRGCRDLPANAWKPFGNGARSCIGRGFALQEAQLVLAMILQRFDLSEVDPGYQLEVAET
jgi:cytochrome P450/NADPH-cytochrome P450 reductase